VDDVFTETREVNTDGPQGLRSKFYLTTARTKLPDPFGGTQGFFFYRDAPAIPASILGIVEDSLAYMKQIRHHDATILAFMG